MISFNNEAFAIAINLKAFEQRLSYRDVAKQAGTSPSTITRVTTQRKSPDANTLARLIKWLNQPFESFITEI